MSLERRYVDILTMGRSGIDIFPLQVGAHLEDVGGTLIHGLVEGRGLERTIRYASAAGAYVCSHIECSTAMPTHEQLHTFVETGVLP